MISAQAARADDADDGAGDRPRGRRRARPRRSRLPGRRQDRHRAAGRRRRAAATTAPSRSRSPASRPADDPRFTVYVVVQNPRNGGGGGSVAGPAFSKIMSYALRRYAVPPTGTASPPASPSSGDRAGQARRGSPVVSRLDASRRGERRPARDPPGAPGGHARSPTWRLAGRRRDRVAAVGDLGTPVTGVSLELAADPARRPVRRAARAPAPTASTSSTTRSRAGAVAILTDPAGAAARRAGRAGARRRPARARCSAAWPPGCTATRRRRCG